MLKDIVSKMKGDSIDKIYGYIFLIISIVLMYMSYIRMLLPPQMGWWNYYGWRIANGDILYGDLYCYMPPYIPLLQAVLYNILGNNMFLFQILGIFLVIAISCITYKVFLQGNKTLVTSIAVLAGTCISASFLVHIPYDYHTIMLLDITIIAYSAAKLRGDSYFYTILMGLAIGIALMIKQTVVVLSFMLIILFVIYKKRIHCIESRLILKHGSVMVVSVFLSMLPALYYLYVNDVFEQALMQVIKATAAKGYSSSPIDSIFRIVQRYIEYGVSLPNITIAVCLFVKYFIDSRRHVLYLNLILLNAIIFKLMSIALFSFNLDVTLVRYLILLALMFGMIMCILFKHNEIATNENAVVLKIVVVCILILELFALIFTPQFLIDIFAIGNGNFFFLVRKSFSEIAFYFCLCIVIFKLYNKNIQVNNFTYWFIAIMCMFQALLLMGSGFLDEAYSLPTVSFLLINICSKESCRISNILYVVITLLIMSLVANKQAVPYAWHGWTSMGIKENAKFIDSNIKSLSGYKLERDTELAYENIIDAINIYADENDTVYEFPHSPLFNCLTERRLGTFAVSHFIDVCPDKILRDDISILAANPPKMFIYVKFQEGEWRINEQFYRSGMYSARKDMEQFYESFIKNNYKCIYTYKNIYVWVREDDSKKNMQFSLSLLRNYSKCYNDKELENDIQSIDVDKLYNVQVNKMSINGCISNILSDELRAKLINYEGVLQVYSILGREYGMPLTNSSMHEENSSEIIQYQNGKEISNRL